MSSTDKFLITGFSGFVSKHFLEYLEKEKISAEVLGVDVVKPEFDISVYKHIKCVYKQIDLLNKDEVDTIIQNFQPNYVLHLASYSSVAFSWKNPVDSFANNTNIFLNLLDKIRLLNINCRILSVGSSEEYGNVSDADLPLREGSPLKPLSPYAVARVAQEMLSKIYAEGYNMDIILSRSFNHIGPGQRDIFVVSSFAKQLVNFKKQNRKVNELVTGDTSIVRDFVDVRDVVRAYYLLFKKGKKGEVYNICSGKGTSLNEIIQMLANILNIQVSTKQNPELVRPNDNKIIIGSNEKIQSHTGWKNTIALEQSLKDVLAYHEKA